MFWRSNFAGEAAQEYGALTGSCGDISKLSTHEGAVRMAIDLALDSAIAFSLEQTSIPVLRVAADRYDAAVNSILGIDPDAVAQILPQILYATTVQGDIKNQASGTAGLLSSILRLGEGALKTVTDHVLGEAPTLQTVQTMFRILKLRDMETGTVSEAFRAAETALLKATSDTLQSAAAQTGHEELDDLTSIANQSSHNLDAVMNRWGFQGVNYIGNLLKAGRGDLEAAITAMPTYAKSAIVAETNMRTFGLNDEAIAAEVCALAADMKSPIVVLSAKQIAKQQAVEARKAELFAGAVPGVSSTLIQKVNEAGKNVNQSKSILDQAQRNEQAGREALTKAQAAFHKNMADTAVTDTLVTSIDHLQKAIDVRVKAQKELKNGQQTLNDAQRKLADTQKQAAAKIDEQAKRDVDAMRMKLAEARAKLMGKAGGQAGGQGNILLLLGSGIKARILRVFLYYTAYIHLRKRFAFVAHISRLYDVSQNTALIWLSCGGNQLTALDVSHNPALTTLACDTNQLTMLNVSNNPALTCLNCDNNQLMTLDVSQNTALTDLSCSDIQLTTLDVSQNTVLESLFCGGNQLTLLDVSNNPALTNLYCDRNHFPDPSAIIGLDESKLYLFGFDPQFDR